MTANPLKGQMAQSERVIAPADKEERARFWIDRGNRILWGQEPNSKGEYLDPRPHLHWCHFDGHYWIEDRL